MTARRTAAAIHRRFIALPGSRHIASEAAIGGLIRCLVRQRPRTVLEVGAGIGTLTATILQVLPPRLPAGTLRLVSIEANDFCLERLRENLGARLDEVTLIPDIEALPVDVPPFDLVIADGGAHEDPRIFAYLAPRAVVFFEGNRKIQAQTLEAALGSRPVVKARMRNLRRISSPDSQRRWMGGYRLYQLDPRLHERFAYLGLRLRAALIYRLRPLLQRFVT